MADKKKKINFWEDPTFQQFYQPYEEQGLRSRITEQNRLNTLRTGIFGAGGELAQNRLQEAEDQNRLAEEMAYRGLLQSGIYSGGQKGLGTKLQGEYTKQRTGLEQKYEKQTNPYFLMQQGLKMNPDGSISPLAPGEEITDLTTGKKSKYNWATTDAGLAAKQAALMQYLSAMVPRGMQ